MKIIKHGQKEETKLFTCKCGCEFEVQKGEYWTGDSWSLTYPPAETYYTCCPECRQVVTLTKQFPNPKITLTGADCNLYSKGSVNNGRHAKRSDDQSGWDTEHNCDG
jgi:hypothetical protein